MFVHAYHRPTPIGFSSYAPYVAAMMNAEVGTHYDVTKFLSWITSSDSSVRNWGCITYNQLGRDVAGLTGEANSDRKYAFFMNSVYPFTTILPMAKYDPSYAEAAGKWALNIANSARYFLPSEWPAQNQSNPEYIGTTEGNVLAYEGFKKYSQPSVDGPKSCVPVRTSVEPHKIIRGLPISGQHRMAESICARFQIFRL